MHTIDVETKRFRRGQLVTVFWPEYDKPWLARYERKQQPSFHITEDDFTLVPCEPQARVEAVTDGRRICVPMCYLSDIEANARRRRKRLPNNVIPITQGRLWRHP